MRRFALLALVLVSGCAGAPPPEPAAAGPEPATGAAPAEAPAGEPATATPEPPRTPGAKIMLLEPSGDDTLVKIMFSNPSSGECTFSAYTLTWPGGKKRIDAKPFHVPAGGGRVRSLRVHKDDGDVSSLDKDSAHVEVDTDCGGS